MPQYLTRKGNTFYFRQGVPEELRAILGRREIKKSLGRDYAKAVQGCKRYAVDADNLIAEARAKLDSVPLDPYSWKEIRRTKRLELKKLTPELESQFGNLMRAALLEGDLNKRIAGFTREEFADYGQEINAALDALRIQLAMGQIEPMLEAANIFMTGRGYRARARLEQVPNHRDVLPWLDSAFEATRRCFRACNSSAGVCSASTRGGPPWSSCSSDDQRRCFLVASLLRAYPPKS